MKLLEETDQNSLMKNQTNSVKNAFVIQHLEVVEVFQFLDEELKTNHFGDLIMILTSYRYFQAYSSPGTTYE